MTENDNFGTWAILELMGHVKLAGFVTEEELFGGKMGRIDVPGDDGSSVTQYFGGHTVYRLTPVTEAIARAFAARSKPRFDFFEKRRNRQPTWRGVLIKW